MWTPELIFISKSQDCYNGHVALLGETDRGNATLGEWLNEVLDSVTGQSIDAYYKPMYVAVTMS